ncbi:Gfo/Idh/MocA family protein [Aquibacillus albus]|uniref:Dehydrogenase n=1 Tax=Aquibacillus albus TaxID=1168171 RepID=A0ABS2MVP4_9BACI|nr:Gfo/Idh/MocA family oxidoreductase [Aquibacillus albus]MBM7569977.1 putative dehydrogenase [Aquibacillus albus]
MGEQEQIRMGFIGAGAMGLIHMQVFSELEGVQMSAVADTSEQRAEAAKSEYGLEKAYVDSEQLISDPDVDAVVISVPNRYHASIAISALNNGKHVLLEKPMAMNAEEATSILEAERLSGKKLMIGHQMRWSYPFNQVKEHIEQGQFGRIYYVKAGWFRRKGIPGWGTTYTSKEHMGGGCAVDIGVHMLDLSLFLVGDRKPISVVGATYGEIGTQRMGIGNWGTPNFSGSFDVEDLAIAMIRLDDGTVINLEVSWAAFTDAEENKPYMHIMGDQGGVSIRDKYGKWMIEKFNSSIDFSPEPTETEFDRTALSNHFLSCIREDKQPSVSGRSGYMNNVILDALYESARTGTEVKLNL